MIGTRSGAWAAAVAALCSSLSLAQGTLIAQPDSVLSESGATFRIDDAELPSPLTLVVYGDTRFTDPSNITATNPKVRGWLVAQIAKEKPAALILTGDLPLKGSILDDYAVFQAETKPWRAAGLRVFPALGNHELAGPDPRQGLENWWTAFPELRQRRWYSARLGSRVYFIALDSDASLLPGSQQSNWLCDQMESMPPSVDFLIIALHHPPVADIQQHIKVDHNPRPNEVALRDTLSRLAATSHARIVVGNGHIHNYERHLVDDVTYLVSGGGGAVPYFVERTPDDLYQSILFPNYHYLKLVVTGSRMRGTMYRVRDPEADSPEFDAKDSFEVSAKGR